MRRHIVKAAGPAVLVLAVTACGGTGSDAGAANQASKGLTVTSPQDGARVTLPFTITWDTSVSLGPPDSGKDHVHVYLDGTGGEYTVATGRRLRVTTLSPGEHTLVVSLRKADHSEAGAESSVDVTVGGNGGSPTTDGGGRGYGY